MAGIFDVLEKSAKKTQKSSKKAISQGKGRKISDAERRRRKKREEEEQRRRQNQQRASQARTDTTKPKQSRPNSTLYQQALQNQYNPKKAIQARSANTQNAGKKTIKKAQTLYEKRREERQKTYDKSHGDLKSAAKTAQKISATGGYVQKQTAGKDGNKHQATSQMQKAMSRTMAAGETEKYFHSGKSVYENSVDKKGKHLYTKKQAKQVSDYWKGLSSKEKAKFIKENYGKEWKELDKEINKEDKKLRKAGDTRVTKKDATAEEYQKLQNALRASNGRAETMEGMIGRQGMSDWASRTAYDYAKGGVATGAQGFIEGMSFGDNTAPFNNYYTDAEKRAIEQGKESGAYTLGYMGGIGAQFAVNGIGAMGSSLAKTSLKGGAKGIAKEAVQGGLKSMTKLDKKALAKQAGKEILADNIVSAPLDVLDAYKTAIDTDGKFDPATFAKTYGLNVAMNTGIGGAMSGGGALYKGAKIKNAISLKNKLETGNPDLTNAERKLMNEINARQGKNETTGYDQYDAVMGSERDIRLAQLDGRQGGGLNPKEVSSKVTDTIRSMRESDRLASGERTPNMARQKTKAVTKRIQEIRQADSDHRVAVKNLEKNIRKTEGVLKRKGLKPETIKKKRAELKKLQRELKKENTKYEKHLAEQRTSKPPEKIESATKPRQQEPTVAKPRERTELDNLRSDVERAETAVKNTRRFYEEAKGTDGVFKARMQNYRARQRYNEAVERLKEAEKSFDGNTAEGVVKSPQKKYSVNRRSLNEGKQRVGTTQEAKETYTRLQKSSINDINERFLNGELTPIEEKTIFGKELEWPTRADKIDEWQDKQLEAIRKWKDVDTKKKPAVVKATKKPKKLKEEPKTETKDKDYLTGDPEKDKIVEEWAHAKFDAWRSEGDSVFYAEERLKKAKEAMKKAGLDPNDFESKLGKATRKEKPSKAKTETKNADTKGKTEKKSEDKAESKGKKKSEDKSESKGKKSEEKKSEKKGSKKKTKQEKSEAKQEKVFKKYTTKEKKEAIEKAVDEKFGKTGEMSADDFLRMVKAEGDFVNAVKDDRLLSETYKKLGAQLIGSVHDTGRIFDVLEGIKESGAGNKRIFKKMSDAVDDAKKDVDKDFDTVYSRVMGAELADDGVSLKKVDPYAYSAESAELLEVLTRRFNETGSLDDLQKIMELTKKNIATNSERGHALKACQALYRQTPTGRYHLALSELNRLNKKFADRLDKPLELTDDEIKAIFRAETEEEIDACFKAINLRVWDDIPSNWFERFNEWRHMTMLANPKTHARNLIGNGVFFLARSASDAMEVRLMKTVAKHVKDKDRTFVMATQVKRSEVKKLKEFTDSEWKQWYKSSNTRSRFIETQRPDGSTEIRLVPVKKLVNFNYKLLEKEDLKFLQPEFNKELVRYCKAHNIPMDGTASKKAMDAARAYAGNKAQVATYRDVSTLSNVLTGWKQKTASRTGKTALGTMGYRAANMVLESQLPFVKTPVNIFRRMMDYSPGGLLKSAAEMHRFVTKGDYDALAESVHYFCTGLTGSGVMLGGAWLAQQGLLMTNAGVMSGDEFYDRDMGFQDYSAMLPEVKLPNGTLLWDKRSLSLDWVAPMATSLFMGATAYEQLSEKGFEMDDITKALGAIANPMMEMSFMSSSKDLIETFLENAVDRATGETHWTDAAFNALAGSIPQGYMTSIFSAQLVAQGAQFSDKYNRDTSSTLDGSVAKSWDRWRKQIINRIPLARQYWLEEKVDRRGRDSETIGDNVVTKFLHAFINPSTTRKINFDDTDREIIKIYNEMPDNTNTEKKKKSFFFYNFTGNPSYDLGNGRRMTNKEKHDYTQENRHQHNIYIKQMIKDKAYNDMTPAMKAAEVDDAHWLATTVADRKVFGDDYAIKKVLGKSSSATDVAKSAVTGEASGPVADREAYDSVMYGAKSDKAKKQAKRDFLNFYIMKEKTVMQTHDSSYYTKAIAVSAYKEQQKALGLNSKNAEKMALAYNIYDSKMQTSDEYFKKGGSMDEYTSAMRRVMSGINIMGASTSQRNKAVSAGTYKKGLINERTRKAFGLSSDMSNMGYGLAQKFDHKYTLKELNAMNTELKMRYNKDKNSSLSKEEIVNYIDSLEKKQGRKISQEEKACLYRYFYTYQSKVNPYGKIPNFLGGEDTSDGTGGYGRRGWGRRGHRGWGHRGWGHHGGGGGGEGAGSYAAWLKKNGYVSGGTSGQSALTEAFRKKQLKNLQNTTGRVKGK